MNQARHDFSRASPRSLLSCTLEFTKRICKLHNQHTAFWLLSIS